MSEISEGGGDLADLEMVVAMRPVIDRVAGIGPQKTVDAGRSGGVDQDFVEQDESIADNDIAEQLQPHVAECAVATAEPGAIKRFIVFVADRKVCYSLDEMNRIGGLGDSQHRSEQKDNQSGKERLVAHWQYRGRGESD